MSRGYAAIALVNPKSGHNVGGAMRAAQVYGADLIVLGGERPKTLLRHPTDTMRAWKHIPTVLSQDVFDVMPYDCVPVAIELIRSATPLLTFHHPERAFYVFGAEDATLGKTVIARCAHVVFVPTAGSMNLAATANVVLYDRLAKRSPR
jgi:tRNA(Leu) C34 or U34 (ribose-2'-O)-methylase TrmL